MKIAYFDCFSGASGDMILGALLDAGLSVERLRQELAKLLLSHYELRAEKVTRKGIGGSRAIVLVDEEHHRHHHRHLRHIEEILDKSELAEPVKRKSAEVFRRLAEAEAKVHQTSVQKVHFHEVGAMDAILDVVGSVAGLAALGIEKLYCSPLHVGSGTVECVHGTLPVPAPATAELIRGKPVYSTGISGELLTPTGAALLTTLCSEFGPMPDMIPENIGYGAGTSERAIPNLLRIVIGEAREAIRGYDTDRVAVLETNIDDMNPQMYDYLMGKMLEMGALDVFLSPVQMKKNRPGVLITILCTPDRVERFSDFLMRETTTLGVRWRTDHRIKAQRRIRDVQTRYGVIRCKVAEGSDGVINIAPEYDDCKRIALQHNIPLKQVMEEAKATLFGEILV